MHLFDSCICKCQEGIFLNGLQTTLAARNLSQLLVFLSIGSHLSYGSRLKIIDLFRNFDVSSLNWQLIRDLFIFYELVYRPLFSFCVEVVGGEFSDLSAFHDKIFHDIPA